jgi:hypothetical protein
MNTKMMTEFARELPLDSFVAEYVKEVTADKSARGKSAGYYLIHTTGGSTWGIMHGIIGVGVCVHAFGDSPSELTRLRARMEKLPLANHVQAAVKFYKQARKK